MEHRWGQRSNVQAAVRLRMAGGAATNGYLQNLSVSGAFVRTRSLAPLGALLELEIPLGTSPGQQLASARAYVARRTPQGIGIEWCDLAPPMALALLGEHRIATHRVLPTDTPLHAPDASTGAPNRRLPIRREPPSWISAA